MTARALMAIVAILIPFTIQARTASSDEAPTATVLCYHIVEAPTDDRMQITRETFRQHLDYLAMTGYNVIPLAHLQEYVSGKRATIPKNAVVITIDDGWRSAYTEAFPELQKRNLPFTLFIYPKIIGNTTIALNWDQIREMSDAGADIQSHSLSHPFLSRRRHLSVDDQTYSKWLYRELAESRRILEKQTGRKVQFLAYPYGDFDSRVAKMAERAGYTAALTCEFGRVKRGSDPLKMKRFVIDKRMDFAQFRKYMGANAMQLADMTPLPGGVIDGSRTVVSARIPNHQSLDPQTVGIALMSSDRTAPYSYDARTGSVSLVFDSAEKALKGKYYRALVWATETASGRRVEATWTFKLPQPDPVVAPVPAPAAPPVNTKVVEASALGRATGAMLAIGRPQRK